MMTFHQIIHTKVLPHIHFVVLTKESTRLKLQAQQVVSATIFHHPNSQIMIQTIIYLQKHQAQPMMTLATIFHHQSHQVNQGKEVRRIKVKKEARVEKGVNVEKVTREEKGKEERETKKTTTRNPTKRTRIRNPRK